MTLRATLTPTVTNQLVTVSQKESGLLTTRPSVTIKNQISEFNSIEQIPDVDEVNVTDGATLQYNATTDKYEIKPLDLAALGVDLDGGTF